MTIPTTQVDIQELLESMAESIRQTLQDSEPLLIGIHTGGVWVAKDVPEYSSVIISFLNHFGFYDYRFIFILGNNGANSFIVI